MKNQDWLYKHYDPEHLDDLECRVLMVYHWYIPCPKTKQKLISPSLNSITHIFSIPGTSNNWLLVECVPQLCFLKLHCIFTRIIQDICTCIFIFDNLVHASATCIHPSLCHVMDSVWKWIVHALRGSFINCLISKPFNGALYILTYLSMFDYMLVLQSPAKKQNKYKIYRF